MIEPQKIWETHTYNQLQVFTLVRDAYGFPAEAVRAIMARMGILRDRAIRKDGKKVNLELNYNPDGTLSYGRLNEDSEYIEVVETRKGFIPRITENGLNVTKLIASKVAKEMTKGKPFKEAVQESVETIEKSANTKDEEKTIMSDYTIIEEMLAAAKKAKELEDRVAALEKQVSDKDEEIELFKDEVSKLTNNNAQLSAEKQKLVKDLNAYENAPLATNKYQQLMEGFGKIQSDMNRIQSEFFEAEKQLATARATFNKADNDRKNTVNKLNALYKDVKSILQIIS